MMFQGGLCKSLKFLPLNLHPLQVVLFPKAYASDESGSWSLLSLPTVPDARTPISETRNKKPETRNSKPEARNPKPEARSPISETRSPKPETRYLKPGSLALSLSLN